MEPEYHNTPIPKHQSTRKLGKPSESRRLPLVSRKIRSGGGGS